MALLLCTLAGFACGSCGDDRQRGDERTRIEPVYDRATGKLQLLRLDADKNGTIDTWSYMDGARVVRIEIDRDGDNKIDRWEHYGPDQIVTRIDVSTQHDGKAERVEFYEKGAMVRAEEDTDGDGTVDKWETYDGPRLASVAFDTQHRGSPDRRLVYEAGGTVRVEIVPNGP